MLSFIIDSLLYSGVEGGRDIPEQDNVSTHKKQREQELAIAPYTSIMIHNKQGIKSQSIAHEKQQVLENNLQINNCITAGWEPLCSGEIVHLPCCQVIVQSIAHLPCSQVNL